MSASARPDEQWLWIDRWDEAQHYRPDPKRAPRWIKQYTRQLDDYRYSRLTPYQRAVLHDLRMVFAQSLHRVPRDTRALSHSVGYRVTTEVLETLNHAGFLHFISRVELESALELLYRVDRDRDREQPVVGASRESERAESEHATICPIDPSCAVPPGELYQHLRFLHGLNNHDARHHVAQAGAA